MTPAELKELIEKYLTEDLSEHDFQRLWDTLQEPGNREIWMSMIGEVWENPAYHHLSDNISRQQALEKLRPMLAAAPDPAEETPHRPLLVRLFAGRTAWWAAAVVIMMACAGAWFLLLRKPAMELAEGNRNAVYKNDVAPANSKAVLTLGNGSAIVLDSAGHQMIRQGNTTIQQRNGLLQYKATGAATGISYNTLTVPRGGKFQIRLPDGTGVWLNAASSIRYPVAFTGKERRVEVTGEAYFEVAKNAAMPFRVSINNRAEVEVLGTHFNINAYEDEAAVSTTLLEGKVKVNVDKQQSAVLQPGQQASLNAAGALQVLRDVDTAQVVAWKEGWFQFYLADLPEVMRQLSRWYDVEVSYQGGIPDRAFQGRMQRELTLTQVLKILEKYQVHFHVEGRMVTVLAD